MTPAELQNKYINDALNAQRGNLYAALGGTGAMFGSLLGQAQQLTSTFNYRKFSKPGEYRKGELRRIVTMVAENGYIRRVK